MHFHFDNQRPIYLQLVEQLKLYIISGRIPPGDKLPSVRDLASLARVNPNTMQRALAELEENKLIYTERTNGKFVTKNHRLLERARREFITHRMYKIFHDLEAVGFDRRDIIKIIKTMEKKHDEPNNPRM